jgi:hypothetical protein
MKEQIIAELERRAKIFESLRQSHVTDYDKYLHDVYNRLHLEMASLAVWVKHTIKTDGEIIKDKLHANKMV